MEEEKVAPQAPKGEKPAAPKDGKAPEAPKGEKPAEGKAPEAPKGEKPEAPAAEAESDAE